MAVAKQGESRWVMGLGPGLASQDFTGQVLGQFWNRTDPFSWTKLGPVAHTRQG
jgi:hypothetical protein